VRSQTAGRAQNLPLRRLGALSLIIGLLALAGCGSSSSSTSSSASTPASTPATTSSATSSTPAPAASAGGSTLALAANPEGSLKFDTTSLSAKAGKVTINFTNQASLEHNVTVASSSGAVVGATPSFAGGSKSVTVSVTPGTYKFYCSVPGHRQAGMEGTLTVK
jgi:plastocyanin